MQSDPVCGILVAATVAALASHRGGTLQGVTGARSEVSGLALKSSPHPIPFHSGRRTELSSSSKRSMGSSAAIAQLDVELQVKHKFSNTHEVGLGPQSPGVAKRPFCHRNDAGQTVGCDGGCRCAAFHQCYAKYELSGNSVGICEPAMPFLALISVGIFVMVLGCVVASRTYLRGFDYEAEVPKPFTRDDMIPRPYGSFISTSRINGSQGRRRGEQASSDSGSS